MSLDQYHFHMVLRQERMIRAERHAADEQAARIAQGLSELGRAVGRVLRRPRRPVGATMELRRIS